MTTSMSEPKKPRAERVMSGDVFGWKPVREEDPDPANWDQTLRELEQLGRVSVWLGEHYPELKGQEIDTAIIGLIGELRARNGKAFSTSISAGNALVKLNEDRERLIEFFKAHPPHAVPSDPIGQAISAMEQLAAKADRLERHIIKLTGHPDGPMSAHRLETPGGGKPTPEEVPALEAAEAKARKAWLESKRLDPPKVSKPADGPTSRRAALRAHMHALRDGKPTQSELRPMLILMAEMLLAEPPSAGVKQPAKSELDVKQLTEVERRTVDGVRNLLGKLKGDGSMSLAEVGERLKNLAPKE